MDSSIPDYVVIDVETTTHNKGEDAVGEMSASPHSPNNDIVYTGSKGTDLEYSLYKTVVPYLHSNNLLVGQNLKFDLLYILYCSEISLPDMSKLKIWDTMIVEYLLSGQTKKYWSLDKLAEKYGGTIKNDKIKEYWEKGISTEDIPEEEILPYLKSDVENTELVFKYQYAAAETLGMLPMIEAQMSSLLATTIMEFNGMKFDIFHALDGARDLQKEVDIYEKKIKEWMSFAHIQDPNPSSNDHVSLLLFGGKQEVETKVNMLDKDGMPLRFKSGKRKGQVRTKKGKGQTEIRGMSLPKDEWKAAKDGFYKVNDEILQELLKIHATGNVSTVTRMILTLRKLNKDLGTYFVGFSKLMWTHDDCIHGTINHCSTATGRLSSTSPNLQNITSKD